MGKSKKQSSKKRQRKGVKQLMNEPIKDHKYYEDIITNLNRKLATLREQTKAADEENYKLIAEMVTIEQDHRDVVEYLKRRLEIKQKLVIEAEKQMQELKEQREDFDESADLKIKELKRKYDETQKELLDEIELLDVSLGSLENVGLQREDLFKEVGEKRSTLYNSNKRMREFFQDYQQKTVVSRDVLRKEIDMRLNQIVNDFQHSNEVRNAAFTRIVVGENIALHKHLDKCQKQYMNLVSKQMKQTDRLGALLESHASVEQMVHLLQSATNHKDHIIERILKRKENMKALYLEAMRYRKMVKDAEQDLHVISDKNVDYLNSIKLDRDRLDRENDVLQHKVLLQDEKVYEELSKFEAIRSAVVAAIESLEDFEKKQQLLEEEMEEFPTETATVFTTAERQNMISKIIHLVSSDQCKESSPTRAIASKSRSPPCIQHQIRVTPVKASNQGSEAASVSSTKTLLYRTGRCGIMPLQREPTSRKSSCKGSINENDNHLLNKSPTERPSHVPQIGSFGLFSKSPRSSVSVPHCPCSETCKCDFCWSLLYKEGNYENFLMISEKNSYISDKITMDTIVRQSCNE